MSEITSKPYNPNPAMACEGCCFNGWHAEWCEHGWFDCGVAEKSDLVRALEANTQLAEVALLVADRQPIGILPHIVGEPCACHECRKAERAHRE